MDLLNTDYTIIKSLENAAKKPFLGFVAGPCFVLIAIVQLALNLVGAVFMALPSICLSANSPWHVKEFAVHALVGVIGVFAGIFAFLPFTSLVLKD